VLDLGVKFLLKYTVVVCVLCSRTHWCVLVIMMSFLMMFVYVVGIYWSIMGFLLMAGFGFNIQIIREQQKEHQARCAGGPAGIATSKSSLACDGSNTDLSSEDYLSEIDSSITMHRTFEQKEHQARCAGGPAGIATSKTSLACDGSNSDSSSEDDLSEIDSSINTHRTFEQAQNPCEAVEGCPVDELVCPTSQIAGVAVVRPRRRTKGGRSLAVSCSRSSS
jgi:hypothetical protein